MRRPPEQARSAKRSLYIVYTSLSEVPHAWLAFNRFISSGYAVGVAASPSEFFLAFGEAEVRQGELIHGTALILYYLCFLCFYLVSLS